MGLIGSEKEDAAHDTARHLSKSPQLSARGL